MKFYISAALVLISVLSEAQILSTEGNKKPKITGQRDLSVREDESITITLFDLEVRDRDDWYPWGFSLKLYPGDNYTLSGNSVIPRANFTGELSVPTTVNDGDDESEKYNLKIRVQPVNDAPVITGQNPISTDQGVAVTVGTKDLIVTDIDNSYPTGFSVNVISGSTSDYTVSGNTITPSSTYQGTINVQVTVSDGDLSSNAATIAISVIRKNVPPIINGQTPVVINEDQSVQIQFAHLSVSDPDDTYPTGFTLSISPGNNYLVSGTTVTPIKDFFGNLVVTVTVSDGKKDSNPFAMNISVKPINDLPVVSEIETDPLLYKVGEGDETLTTTGLVSDPDNDSIVSAVVRFQADRYQIAGDELRFENTADIKGNFEIQTGVLTLKGIAPLSSYTKVLRSIKYNFVPAVESQFKEKAIEIILNDGTGDGPVAARTIKMTDLDIDLDIPNAFTPNGDLANDTWKIKPLKQSEELTKAVVRVYTKSGKLVFEGKGFEDAWDGRMNGELLPADTYYYTIDLNLKFSKALRKGLVTLLR